MGFFRNMGRGETCCTDCGQDTPCEPCVTCEPYANVTSYSWVYCNDSSNRQCTLEAALANANACMAAAGGGVVSAAVVAYNQTSSGECPNYGALMGETVEEETFFTFHCLEVGESYKFCWRIYAENNVGTEDVSTGSVIITAEDTEETASMSEVGMDLSVEQLYPYAAAATPVGALLFREALLKFDYVLIAPEEDCPW